MVNQSPGRVHAGQQPARIPGQLENEDQNLANAIAPLGDLGFPTQHWTVHHIHSIPLPVKNFISALRIITTIGDLNLRGEVLALGQKYNFWAQNSLCKAREMVQFCQWLKTPPGMQEKNGVEYAARLRWKAPEGRTVSQTDLISAFQQMLADYSQATKRIRLQHNQVIEDLRRQIQQEQAAMDAELDNVGAEYEPATGFVEPNEIDFVNSCLQRYREDCAKHNQAMLPINDDLLNRLRNEYGQAVREEGMNAYLQAPNVSERVLEYFNNKIANLTAAGDLKAAGTFRKLVDAASAGVAETISQTRATAASRAGARKRNRNVITLPEEPAPHYQLRSRIHCFKQHDFVK